MTDMTTPTPQALAKMESGIDNIYNNIYQSQKALQEIYVDGEGQEQLPTQLQAFSVSSLLPATESEMLLAGAIPASEADIMAARSRESFEKSLDFKKFQAKALSRTLAENTGSRVRVAYRLCRYFTHMVGIGEIGTPCSALLANTKTDANIYEMPMPYPANAGWARGLQAPKEILRKIIESPYQYTYTVNGKIAKTHGMSILPPPLHDGYFQDEPHIYRTNRKVPAGYDPTTDVPLTCYLNIMEFLARHLGIGDIKAKADRRSFLDKVKAVGTEQWHHIADERAALATLLNPKLARLAWPSRDDLETFEEYILAPNVEGLLVDNSQIGAEHKIKDLMGLTHVEALDFLEIGKTYAQHMHTFDADRERSIMLSRISKLAETCEEAGMVTTQLNSFRTVLQVLGLTRQEEDTNLDKRKALSSALEEKLLQDEQSLPENTEEVE